MAAEGSRAAIEDPATPASPSSKPPSPVPDVLAPGLRVVFCGINPGRWSASAGAHFANPRNDFWRLLHDAAFTPRLYAPAEQHDLPALGLGLTNAAYRTTAGSGDLRRAGGDARSGRRAGADGGSRPRVRTRPVDLDADALVGRRRARRPARADLSRTGVRPGAGTGRDGARRPVDARDPLVDPGGRRRLQRALLAAPPPRAAPRARRARPARGAGRRRRLAPAQPREMPGRPDAEDRAEGADQPRHRFVIGVRRSRPNAFGRSFTPGGAWRRLYSARSMSAIARSTVSGSKPSVRRSSCERSSSTYASSTRSSSG